MSNLKLNGDLGNLDGGAEGGTPADNLSARDKRYASRALIKQQNSVPKRKTFREKRKPSSKTTKTDTSTHTTAYKPKSFIARMRSPRIPSQIPVRVANWNSKHAESMKRYDNNHNLSTYIYIVIISNATSCKHVNWAN